MISSAELVVSRLVSLRATLAVAESCTGGLLAATLTGVPGASQAFDRGFITYSNQAKSEMLGISPALISQHGAVSREVALAMAEAAQQLASTRFAVSITGIAGPTGATEHKPVGLVHFAIAERSKPVQHHVEQYGNLNRQAIQYAAVETALTLLKDRLQ